MTKKSILSEGESQKLYNKIVKIELATDGILSYKAVMSLTELAIIEKLEKEINMNIVDFDKSRKSNEFVCPDEYEMRYQEANTSVWLRHYFMNIAFEKVKSLFQEKSKPKGE